MTLTEQNHKALHTITIQMTQSVMVTMKLITEVCNSNKFLVFF